MEIFTVILLTLFIVLVVDFLILFIFGKIFSKLEETPHRPCEANAFQPFHFK